VQLFSLSARWVRLSAPPNFIEAKKPEQNGGHERIYRCLKAETTGRPTNTCRGRERKFDPLSRGVQQRAAADPWWANFSSPLRKK
jgi:hypothetical protein